MTGLRVNTLGDYRHGARSLRAWRDQRTDPAAAERDGISRCSAARPGAPQWKHSLSRSLPLPSPEMGDRTQLPSLVLAAHYRKPWPILAGVLLATLANHALAEIIGVWFGEFLSPALVDSVVGISMIAMALWVLKPDSLDDTGPANRRGAFVATLIAFFIAEIGDKTQIATVALAAGYSNLAAVVAGTTCGMLLANAPVVFLRSGLRGPPAPQSAALRRERAVHCSRRGLHLSCHSPRWVTPTPRLDGDRSGSCSAISCETRGRSAEVRAGSGRSRPCRSKRAKGHSLSCPFRATSS